MTSVPSVPSACSLVQHGLREVASLQAGVVRFSQGLEFGSSHAVRHELESDLWVQLGRGIYLLRGRPLDDLARAF
ncbi:MAG: hypothetical protein P8N02_12195 [Actinomycetota bacterium]|jgi:hypothetical protein|nr:hypothetical protein [Actinomycetota bacterium]